MQTLQTDSSRIDHELETTAQKLEQYEESLAQTQAEIQRAAGTGDPVSESNRVRKEIERLQHWLAEAGQAEAEAKREWHLAAGARCHLCRRTVHSARPSG